MDKPVSQKFLQVEHNSIITGTTPHDSETRPHVQVSVDDSALNGEPNDEAKPIAIIGPSTNGMPNHVYKITSIEEAKRVFGGGDLVTAIELAWQPSGIAYGNGGVVYAERVQDATQSTLDVGALHFRSTAYGDNANDNAVSLQEDPLENGTWDVEVSNKHDSYKADYNGLGLLANIQYVPNSWDKYSIPRGQSDYARATVTVKPAIQTRKAPNGTVIKNSTGRASKLVFNIHDTKEPAIFHNNVTNNFNGGSTIYDVDDPNSNGDTVYNSGNSNYDGTTPFEHQSDQPASAGFLNPARGPFVDKTFTVDLTNPKFTSMTALLAYLQQMNFGGNAHLEINADENAHLSHIPPYLLDISEDKQNIMGKLDGTTQDGKGNVVEPGGLWSTLGSIVDALRYNPKVHASADMSKQLNFISTVPPADDHLTSLADEYENSANAASLDASYDYSEASVATNNNVNSLASEYTDVAKSYEQNMNDYNNLASSADNQFWNDINDAAYGSTKADSTATTVASSASNTVSADNQALNTLYQGDQTPTKTSQENSLNDKTDKARKAAITAAKNAKASDKQADEHKNMQYVQNYTINLIAQLKKQLFANHAVASNIIDGDLNALTRVSHYMQHPAQAVDVSIVKAGQKAAQPLMKTLEDLKDYRNGVKGSKDALNIDLGYVEQAIDSAKSNQTAPKGIIPNAYDDGAINILGEAIYAFNTTNLTGGYTSQVPIDWSNKFKYFNDTPVYDIVAVSPRESVHANLAAYIGDRFEANHNMRGFVGGGTNESTQELISRSAALDNERICLYGTSGDYTIADGLHEDIPAYLGAAIVAGIDSSLLPGDSILNKKIAYNRIDQDFSSSELDALNANGVITANPVVNRGVTSEYTISNDVTTNNDSSDPIKAQLSLGEVTDYLFDELRGFLQKDIGRVVTAGSSDQIVTDVNAFLHDHCSKYNGGEGIIVDYKSDDTFCEIHNESAYITFNVAPSMPLKYISVVGRYSGFDEQSGDNSEASFQFIGTNGEMSDDDDDQDDTDSGYEDADNLINGSSV